LESNAKAKIAEGAAPIKGDNYFKNFTGVPEAPVIIGSTEDIGTDRVRANHIDAAIHYFTEQETLKKANAPIE